MDTAAVHRKSDLHGLSANQLPPAVLLSNTIHEGGCCLLLTAVPSAGLLSSSFLNSQLCRHICHIPLQQLTSLFPLSFLLAYTSLYLPAPGFLDLPPLTSFSDFLLHTTPIFYSVPFSRALLAFVPGVGDWGQRVVRVGVPSLCIVRPVVDQSSAL